MFSLSTTRARAGSIVSSSSKKSARQPPCHFTTARSAPREDAHWEQDSESMSVLRARVASLRAKEARAADAAARAERVVREAAAARPILPEATDGVVSPFSEAAADAELIARWHEESWARLAAAAAADEVASPDYSGGSDGE